MNFQSLQKVETADTYIDIAFKAARDKSEILRQKKSRFKFDKLLKSKAIEREKIGTVAEILENAMERILNSFPMFTELSRYYQELVRIELDFPEFKRALAGVSWIKQQIALAKREYSRKIVASIKIEDINGHRRGFYGRVSSYMKQINPQLRYLDECRKIMKEFPTVKTSVYTVCLFGFPNVGKSTLLAKISTAKPEIKDYAFTTKKLNLGYIKEPGRKIQLIDTPGSLNRFDKMNVIEREAYLAIKHCAELVVFVFDPTDTYDEEKQFKLFESIKKFGKQTIVYISKTDIADKKRLSSLLTKMEGRDIGAIFMDSEKLKEYFLSKKEALEQE